MGFYCPDAAEILTDEDDQFEIYGTAVQNGEVLVYQEQNQDSIRSVGYIKGREQLTALAKQKWPDISEYCALSPHALNYSLEDQQIDGAIMDVIRAGDMESCDYKALSDTNYDSYVLVVRRDMEDKEAFKKFLTAYNKAAQELSASEDPVQQTAGTRFLLLNQND